MGVYLVLRIWFFPRMVLEVRLHWFATCRAVLFDFWCSTPYSLACAEKDYRFRFWEAVSLHGALS